MKRVALCLLLAACATPVRSARAPASLSTEALLGTWRVEASTFPMWLDGSRLRPRFTYAEPTHRGLQRSMHDVVSYETSSGAVETIEGDDVQHGTVDTHFTWTGRGWLAAFSSEWDVAFLDPGGRFAIITFSPTLATPAGLDVIARTPLDAAGWAAALQVIEQTPELSRWHRDVRRLSW